MPPQQSDGLLDVGFQRKRFGAHSLLSGTSPWIWRAELRGGGGMCQNYLPHTGAMGDAVNHSNLRLTR